MRTAALGLVALLVLASCDAMLGPRAAMPELGTGDTLDLGGGTYNPWAPGLVVTATTTQVDGVIHYTIDGSVPSIRSPVFPEAGLEINETTTVRVITVAYGFRYSYENSWYFEIETP